MFFFKLKLCRRTQCLSYVSYSDGMVDMMMVDMMVHMMVHIMVHMMVHVMVACVLCCVCKQAACKAACPEVWLSPPSPPLPFPPLPTRVRERLHYAGRAGLPYVFCCVAYFIR